MVAKRLLRVLQQLAATDVKQRKTGGFEYLGSRPVVCGSEHAFRLPMGYSCMDVQQNINVLMGAVGAPVELIDRLGAVVVRVITKDFPREVKVNRDHIREQDILIGYDRLMNPVYHPLNTHILVGGASGSGKTDGLRFWLWQLYMQGYEIRISDLKGFSFFPFEVLPNIHVAKNLPEAHEMLVRSYIELNDRKQTVIDRRNRNLTETFKPVVVVIDEAAALAPKQHRGVMKKLAEECDDIIAFFGQQSREPRMFMLYCTQRPSVDVINLQFRANVEATIGFRTMDAYNSKLITGKEGAEKISPHTPGRCIYTFDRDYMLQVPYVGKDPAWERFLAPLKTEVLQHGKSHRAPAQRTYLDGVVTRADRDHQTTGDTEQQSRPNQKSLVALARAGEGKDHPKPISRQRKDMEPYTARAKVAGDYSDSIE